MPNAKSWGGSLGRARSLGFIIAAVSRRAAEMQLSIEVGSDPIAGSVSVDAGAPERFRGWIELVAAIESARHTASGGGEESLGAFRGAANGGAI